MLKSKLKVAYRIDLLRRYGPVMPIRPTQRAVPSSTTFKRSMEILCQAKAAMGKTTVFPPLILKQLEPENKTVNAVALYHTREFRFLGER